MQTSDSMADHQKNKAPMGGHHERHCSVVLVSQHLMPISFLTWLLLLMLLDFMFMLWNLLDL